MKTATIVQYHVFGTKNVEVADICYRGKILKTIYNCELPDIACSIGHLVNAASNWAFANGFTHTKINFN